MRGERLRSDTENESSQFFLVGEQSFPLILQLLFLSFLSIIKGSLWGKHLYFLGSPCFFCSSARVRDVAGP